jgi:MFS family permease
MITIAPLVAEDLLGSPRWSGVPSTAAIVGGAIGTTLLAGIMARRGRYDGLLAGYVIAAVSSALAGAAVMVGSLPLFITALFFVGAGAGANRLARYASADLYPPERRAASISWMVWGATIGSIAGPTLLEPSRALATGLALAGEAGPFILGTSAIVLSAVVLLAVGSRPLLSQVKEQPSPAHRTARELVRIPRIRLALLAMVVGQIVMVLIMTMTPIHIRGAGHGLAAIGLVISAHTFGMYALSPVTGMLCDRVGRIPVMLAGDVMLIVSGLTAAAAGSSQGLLIVALFLLGLGWNFGFVAGSALLTDDAPVAIRIQLQGVADSVIWGSGGVASLASGVLVAGWGYPTLSLAGAALALVPVVAIGRYAIARQRRSGGPAWMTVVRESGEIGEVKKVPRSAAD